MNVLEQALSCWWVAPREVSAKPAHQIEGEGRERIHLSRAPLIGPRKTTNTQRVGGCRTASLDSAVVIYTAEPASLHRSASGEIEGTTDSG